ncbi:MAG: helix-turn-helix domain-containing protein [Mediterranea sp.]|nr:helix-turn-helix domain-containing protein [Mediterranea sp.]
MLLEERDWDPGLKTGEQELKPDSLELMAEEWLPKAEEQELKSDTLEPKVEELQPKVGHQEPKSEGQKQRPKRQKLKAEERLSPTITLAIDTPASEAPHYTSQQLTVGLHKWLQENRRFISVRRLSVQEAAIALHTNRTTLREAVKSDTGKTLLEYVRVLQLDYACRLMKQNSKRKMESIAIDCGLSKATLYRLFKSELGITPAEYKKKIVPPKGHSKRA